MTKEELEKESKKHCNETLCSVCENPTCTEQLRCREWRDRRAGYYCGAEPREKRIEELEKENAELRKEWQEQVQKANDEGYARTLQTIQLTKAKEIIKGLLSFVDSLGNYSGGIFAKAEQFLQENTTYERIQKAKYNYID